MLRRHALTVGAAVAASPFAARAQQGGAEAWPSRPVTILVPSVAGGPSDVIAQYGAQRGVVARTRPMALQAWPP